MGKLDGKVALLTGGGGGFGCRTACLFAQEGADILICDIDEKALAASKEKIAAFGHKVVTVKCNVGVEEDVKKCFEVLDKELGKIDILVNVAGLSRTYSIVDHPTNEWALLMNVNLDSCFYFCREAAGRMVKAGNGGSILSLGSIAAMTGRSVSVAYAATKAGIVGMTRCMANELAPHGIRVNAICPGPVETPVWRDFDDDVKAALMATIKLNRMGNADDIANLLLFLADDEGSWITGEAININGGAFMG